MKNFLAIFFLFPFLVNAQISINKNYSPLSATTTNATSFGVTNATFTAGKLYIFIAAPTGTTNNGTLTTTSTTWTSVVNVGDATQRIQIFKFKPSTTVTGEAVNLGTFGGGSTGYATGIWEISGADDVIQSTSQAATTGSNPSLTLSSLANSNSGVIAVFANNANTPTGSAEGGWTEDFDAGYNSPTSGCYVMSRLATTDNTPSYTASSSTWLGVALEIKASPIIKSLPLHFY